MAPGGANDAGFWWSWRISSGSLLGGPFHQTFFMCTKSTCTLFFGVDIKSRRRSPRRCLYGKCVDVNSDVIEGRGQSLIRTAELRFVSERMFCLEADPMRTGHRVCRVAQLVLKSAAARQQGGAHQRRLVINHHSCSRLHPVVLPISQKDGRDEWTTVASKFHWQTTELAS